MITYEYKCQKCEHNFDTQQSIKDKPLKKCPQCKKMGLERVISVGIAFVKEELGPNSSVGRWAEHNSYKKFGKYELEDKRKAQSDANIAARQQVQYDMAERLGTTPIEYAKLQDHSEKIQKINKMTKKQKQDYISKGKGL